MTDSTPSYDNWNKAIGRFFFRTENAGTPVYLQIDSDTLGQIAKTIDIPAEKGEDAFIQAVYTQLSNVKDEPLRNITRQTKQWWTLQKIDEYPPCLGILAFCVLAASKMYSDKELGFSSGNYYRHLEDLLNGRWKNFKREFLDIDYFWEKLNQWIKENNYGIPTASNWKGREHIGWPISQVLLRQADREKLPTFFQFCDWQPNDPTIQASDATKQLQRWILRTSCKLTKSCKQILSGNDQESIQRIAEMVLAEYQKWDGSQTDQEGNCSVEIRLQITLTSQRFNCQLYSPAPPKFPEGNYTLVNGKTFNLKREPEVENWFERLEGTTELLDQFFKNKTVYVHQGKYQLRLTPRKIIPFQENEEIGDWVSCNRTAFNTLHLILCHQDYQEQVKQFLEQHADSKWQCLKSSQSVFDKWVCFKGVKILKTPTNLFDSENLDVLIPSRQVAITFKNGLAIRRGVWLKGAEPQLVITLDQNTPKTVLIGEREIEVPESGIIELQDLQLPPAQYTIKVGSQTKKFEISDPTNVLPSNYSQLGHALWRNGEQVKLEAIRLKATPTELQSGQLSICGAKLIGSQEDTQFSIEHKTILPFSSLWLPRISPFRVTMVD